jgi:hypothetical protein
MAKLELLPVPPELVPRVWRSVCLVALRKIPGYDIARMRTRLLVGRDRLWVAYHPWYGQQWLYGVIITSLSDEPPSTRPCFRRQDPALRKSLTIHLAGEYQLLSWLDSAIERINRYAREQGCRQLFLLARKGWQSQLTRWWSKEWEGVAIGRDRATKSTCSRFRFRNRPGYFRPLVPLPAGEGEGRRYNKHVYGFMGTAYFKQQEDAA